MIHRPPSPREADNLPLLIALTIACRVRPTTCAASPTVYTQFPYTGCRPRPGEGNLVAANQRQRSLQPVGVGWRADMIAVPPTQRQIEPVLPSNAAGAGRVWSGSETDSVQPLRSASASVSLRALRASHASPS